MVGTLPVKAAFRDAVLFLGGLGILGYELIVSAEPRLVFIGLAAGMLGLPASLLTDRSFGRDLDADPSTSLPEAPLPAVDEAATDPIPRPRGRHSR